MVRIDPPLLHAEHEAERSSDGTPWDTADWDGDPDWDFNSAADDTPDQLYAIWDSTIERSREKLDAALADGGLDQLVYLA